MKNPAEGTWTTSGQERQCTGGCRIQPGDWMRADGSGGWQCNDCGQKAEHAR